MEIPEERLKELEDTAKEFAAKLPPGRRKKEEGLTPQLGRKFLLGMSLLCVLFALMMLGVQMRVEHHFVPYDIVHLLSFFVCIMLYIILFYMTRYVGAFNVSADRSLYDGKNMIPLTLLMLDISITLYGIAIAWVDYYEERDLFYAQIVIAQGGLVFVGSTLLYWRGYLMSREERQRQRALAAANDYDVDDTDFADMA